MAKYVSAYERLKDEILPTPLDIRHWAEMAGQVWARRYMALLAGWQDSHPGETLNGKARETLLVQALQPAYVRHASVDEVVSWPGRG